MFNLPPPRHISTLPGSGGKADIVGGPSRAISDYMRRSKTALYSITSSALASSEGGTVRPSALAVLRLITNSNLVGC